MGGDDVAGVGFAAGMERLSLLTNANLKRTRPIAVINMEAKNIIYAMKIAQAIRKNNISVLLDYNIKFEKALKNALKDNASHAIFIGDEEVSSETVKLKNLDTRFEEIIKINDLLERF